MSRNHFSTLAGGLRFMTTRWTVVREAGGPSDDEVVLKAREELCRIYWKPVFALLVARGLRRPDAEDTAQDFFQRLLAGERLARVSSEGARFRVWLRQAVENFCISAHRRRSAAKRGGGADHVEVEDHHLPAGSVESAQASSDNHARTFDRAWADAVLEAAVAALQLRYASDGQERLFAALAPYVQPDGDAPLENLEKELELAPAAARKALERFRRRFREAIRTQVALTVAEPTAVDEEMRYLRDVLSR